MAEEGFKKFRSPHNETVRIALTSGHVALVGPEWKTLHPRFHPEAYAQRCISEDMLESAQYEKNRDAQLNSRKYEEERQAAKDAIYKVLEDNDPKDFNKTDGKPKAAAINAKDERLNLDNRERDAIWQEILDEMEEGNVKDDSYAEIVQGEPEE